MLKVSRNKQTREHIRAIPRRRSAVGNAIRRGPARTVGTDDEAALGEEFTEAMGLAVTEMAEFELAIGNLRVPELV